MSSELWYWLSADSFTIAAQSSKAYQLQCGDRDPLWIPKSQLRITEGKKDWEVTEWWLKKHDLLELADDEEPHGD